MNHKTKNPVSELLNSRSKVTETVFVVILLAFSINLISSSLPILLNIPPLSSLVIGFLIGLIAFAYLVYILVSNAEKKHSIQGFLIYSKRQNKIIPFQRYDYGRGIHKYLSAAFVEDKKLKAEWQAEPLKDQVVFVNGLPELRYLKSHQIIVEATEYFILYELSRHLSAYFDTPSFSRNDLLHISRENIPLDVMRNRFLSTFSKPFQERPSFVGHEQDGTMTSDGEMLTVFGKDNTIFQKFELIMPAKSKIKRVSDNSVEISTDRFKLIIEIEFVGVAAGRLPTTFYKFYLSKKNWKNFNEFAVKINISARFRINSFLSNRGWQYYYWVDSFLQNLDDLISYQLFFNKIDWEGASTVLEIFEHQKKTISSKKESIVIPE